MLNFRGVSPTAQVLTKLEANSTDFYRQMASATLPEDLTVQAGKTGGGREAESDRPWIFGSGTTSQRDIEIGSG